LSQIPKFPDVHWEGLGDWIPDAQLSNQDGIFSRERLMSTKKKKKKNKKKTSKKLSFIQP